MMVKDNYSMTLERHLANAPIREALVDIAVKLPEDIDLAALQVLRDQISPDYPQSNDIMQAEFRVEWKDLTPPEIAKKSLGFACRTTEGNRLVQFRLNGFTYNWLKPYSDWPALRAAAEEYWQIYSEAVRPVTVTRLALRYINNLTLPLDFADFAEYLVAQPNIPAELPQTLNHFLTRVGLSEETGLSAVVTQVFEGITNSKELTIILDIDASKQVSLGPRSNEIWQTLDQLRVLKNRIFFASLTERAVRLFE
jgi:uncharacterized protein (TIGR04255 family)